MALFRVQLQQRIYNPNRRTSEAGPRKPFQVRKVACPRRQHLANPEESSDYSEEVPVTINVSGQRFETRITTLERFPDSLLGDAERRAQYYDHNRNEYFFERNRRYFSAILEFYQSNGVIRRPENVMVHHLVSEILFFGLGEDVLENFLQDEDMLFLKKPIPKNVLQRQVWDMFEYPATSIWAKMVATLNVVLVILAVINSCVQTLPQYRHSVSSHCPTNYSLHDMGTIASEVTSTSAEMSGFMAVEVICNSWFLVDLIVRFAATPTRSAFFCQIMNVIDVLSVIPFVVDLGIFLNGTKYDLDAPAGGLILLVVLRLFRVLRIFRILKLSRYSDGLEILWLTLKSARQELTVMFLLVSIGLTVFSGAIYMAEFGHPKSDFHSIPDAFWWTIITGTSVGYGDMIPKRPVGKLIGALCSVSGVICLAFFVPIVVAHFEYYFHHGKELKRLQDVLDQYDTQQTENDSDRRPHGILHKKIANPEVRALVDLETGEKLQ